MSGPGSHDLRSSAQRAAAEAFVYVMRRFGVRTCDLVAEAWGHAGSPAGADRGGARRYRVAPPFWTVTVESDQAGLTGYAVNTRAEVIRYAQRDFRLTDAPLDTQYGPGCREMLARATSRNHAFVCEPVPATEAGRIVADYLVDAAMSQAEGCGPLIMGVLTSPPQRDAPAAALECSVPWRASSARSSTGTSPAGSSTRTTTSSRS